ncbi:MAG TPA: hypothetical protein DGK91_13925 [Clostridium sp.]|nr:hypothetical protein [Clostridia bacterium]HCW05507.1 hypothetical protein [Clostridium sp.]
MIIDVNELGSALNELINKCNKSNIRFIETTEDYFWYIDTEDSFDLEQEPQGLCVGSICEDYEELRKLTRKLREPNILDFERCANILKALSESINKSKDNIS